MKQSIQASQGHPAENQKLIFSGKILADEKTIGDYEIKEKDFLVVMVSKPKAKKPADEPKSESSSTAAATTAEAPATPAPKQVATEFKATEAPATATSETTAQASSGVPETPASQNDSLQTGSFLSGADLETAINNIVEMGFPKNDVQRAMRMSFNNPDRAVEYLMNGLPEEVAPSRPTAVAPATPATPSPAASNAAANNASTTPAPRSGNLFEQAAALQAGGGAGANADAPDVSMLAEDDGQGRQVLDIGNPQILAQLRQLLEQNPAALQPLIQALVQSNPQLAEALSADPDGVLRMLAGEGLEGEESFEIPSLQQLQEEDRTQVEQIMAMGIPESKAIECYFMCGRNLEMAVQYYFEVCQIYSLTQRTRRTLRTKLVYIHLIICSWQLHSLPPRCLPHQVGVLFSIRPCYSGTKRKSHRRSAAMEP